MARGFLAGAIWGLVVSGVGLAALSVAMGPPANLATPPLAAERDASGGAQPEAPVSEPADAEPSADSAPEMTSEMAPDAAPVSEPEPESESAEIAPDAASEAAPDAVTDAEAEPPAESEMPQPSDEEAGAERALAEGSTDPQAAAEDTAGAESQPVPPPARRPSEERGIDAATPGPSLSAPGLAEGSAPDTQPAQRPEAIPAPRAPDAPGTSEAARLSVGGDAPVQPGQPSLPPEAPLSEAEPALSTDPAQPPEPAQDSGLAAAPETDPAETEVPDDPDIGTAPAPEMEQAQAAETEPQAERDLPRVTVQTPERSEEISQGAADDGTDTRPAIGTPADSLLGRKGAVEQGRLPVVADTDTAPVAAPTTEDSPLARFAAAADAEPEAPTMSIVLIDDGSGPLGPEAVEAFPFPVSFAISPDHPDAAATAAAYRARGFEVLALAELPQGATPSDAEVALEGALGTVPEAIGVLEGTDLDLHQSREIGTQAAQFLRDAGHGLLLMANGLNTAEALARREGVPALTVFRDFDGKGQDPRVMRRFLDQAAFKARQEEGVVMLGRLRADTVSALLLWGLQDRANSVALVPVSALLLRQEDEG